MNQRALEAGARADALFDGRTWQAMPKSERQRYIERSRAHHAHLKDEGFVVVRAEPTEPTEAMWGGLARDLVMWDRGIPNQYGSTLYKHLRACGRPIPDWLLAEIPDIDHTPPKGTVAVCIYRAMLSAATTGENDALPDGERP